MRRVSLKSLKTDAIYRNSSYLLASTAVVSILGATYWAIAANLYSASEIGVAAALLAVLNVVTSTSLLGFEITLVRYLANHTRQRNLLVTTFLVGSALSVICAVLAAWLVPEFSAPLSVLHKAPFAAFFIVSCPISLAGFLIESSFIALGEGFQYLLKGTVFSIGKIALILLLVPLGTPGIYVSWLLALAVAVVVAGLFLTRRVELNGTSRFTPSTLKGLWGFSINNYIAAFAEGCPVMVLPVLVITVYGQTASARYYMAMTICSALYLTAVAGAQSLFSVASRSIADYPEALRKSARFIALLTLPSAAIIFCFGPTFSGSSALLTSTAVPGWFGCSHYRPSPWVSPRSGQPPSRSTRPT